MLVSNLLRVCELQKEYSSENTPAMQERGALIRSSLVQDLRDELPSIAPSFGDLAQELSVEGSDGIGRKTEAPRAADFKYVCRLKDDGFEVSF